MLVEEQLIVQNKYCNLHVLHEVFKKYMDHLDISLVFIVKSPLISKAIA